MQSQERRQNQEDIVTHESSSKEPPSNSDTEETTETTDENDRPTINPPFDVAAFARAATSAESDLSTTRPPPPPAGSDAAIPAARPSPVSIVEKPSAETRRSESTPSIPAGLGRSPSALWLVDALVPSAPPPRESIPANEGRTREADSPTSSPAPEITERTIDDPMAEMRERESLGDYSGALEMAELILAAEPDNQNALDCVESCRTVLENMYAAKLGPLDRAPIVIVPRAQLRWLSIDHRAGFILSLIDGASPIDMIIDVSGMPKLDALRILHELVQQRIVSFKT